MKITPCIKDDDSVVIQSVYDTSAQNLPSHRWGTEERSEGPDNQSEIWVNDSDVQHFTNSNFYKTTKQINVEESYKPIQYFKNDEEMNFSYTGPSLIGLKCKGISPKSNI